TECNRRGSEATSESSNSSIRYIDQEASMSGGSSTDTLPGIRADYLDPEPLSPGADALTSPSGITVILNGTTDLNERQIAQDENHQAALHSAPSPTKKSSSNGSSWRRKLMLRLRSNDSSSLNNGEVLSSSTSPSPASESTMESTSSSRNPRSEENGQDVNATATTISSSSVQIDMVESSQVAAASVGDIPSLENGFSEPEEENDDDVEDEEENDEEEEACNAETETEDGSSLPSSPAAASTVGLTSSAVP
ncbi:hypothetical protein EAG_00675, partial [Camponotus floridanus]